MAKGNPIRIEEGLLRSAKQSGARRRRSAAEQVEHWADIGRRFEGIVTQEVMDDVLTGGVRVSLEPLTAAPIDPAAVFAELDRDRDTGLLASLVSEAPARYQASRTCPGKLERIDTNGTVTIGRFQDGQFIPSEEAA